MPIIDEYSMTAIPLNLMCKGTAIGVATGFFYVLDGHRYLVSNWHVFSGRNTYTGQANRKDAALPDALRISLHTSAGIGTTKEFDLKLYDQDEAPIWRQHKDGQDVDIAVLSCRKLPYGCVPYEVPRGDDTLDMAFKIAMDAYILGFPKGIANNKIFPIWKRASIASEPELPHANRPLVLVDTATREGMSGAPAFLRTFGGYQSTSGDQQLRVGSSTRFIGIYSGRYGGEDEFAAQLGRVWLREVIDEVARTGVPGSYELRSITTST